jgi:hypothetical protein
MLIKAFRVGEVASLETKKGGYRKFGFKNQRQCIKALNHAT